jgi:hypothetical protein
VFNIAISTGSVVVSIGNISEHEFIKKKLKINIPKISLRSLSTLKSKRRQNKIPQKEKYAIILFVIVNAPYINVNVGKSCPIRISARSTKLKNIVSLLIVCLKE